MKLLALGVLAAAALAAPSPAAASSVAVQAGCADAGAECRGPFVAVTGTGVDLVLERRGSELSVRDRAGELTAGEGCRAVDAHEALCPVLDALPQVRAGAGGDRVTLLGQPADVRTGAGADVIAGSDGADVLDGGEGLDAVFANGGDDAVNLGDGRDERVEGGPGLDRLTFAGRRGAVDVDLSAGTVDGERFAAGFQHATGTPGADTLRGTSGANALDGGAGEDSIDGRTGDDRIDAGPGPDRALGGPGDDRIETGAGPDRADGGSGDDAVLADPRACPEAACGPPDGGGDDVACGTGRDRLERARPIDDASGCERIVLFGGRVRLTRLADGRLLVTPLSRCGCRRIAVVVREQATVAAGSRRPARPFALRPKRRWPRWGTVSVWLDGRSGGGLVLRLR